MIKWILLLLPFLCFPQGSIIFDTGFESLADFDGTSDAWRSDIPGDNSTFNLVGNAREGSLAARFLWNAGGERTEIVKQNFFDWNTEYWLGYSIKIITPLDGYGIITQHRPGSTNGTNSFSLMTPSVGTLRVGTATDETEANVAPPNACAICRLEVVDVSIVPGQWVDVVMHFSLDDNNGYWEVWVNGTKVVDKVGTSLYVVQPGGAAQTSPDYAKIGLYYGPGVSRGEVHFDAYKVWEGAGGSYEDVSPLGLSPGAGGGTPPIIPSIGSGKQKTGTSQLIAH